MNFARESVGRYMAATSARMFVRTIARPQVTGLQEFQPRRAGSVESLLMPKLESLAGLTEEEFGGSFVAAR